MSYATIIRAKLEAEKKRIEDILNLSKFDDIIAFGEQAGMIQQQGILLHYDIDEMQRTMAKTLYNAGVNAPEIIDKTNLSSDIVTDIIHHVEVKAEMDKRIKRIEKEAVPNAFEVHFMNSGMSVRAANIMRSNGMETVGDLIRQNIVNIKTIDGLGAKSRIELTSLLEELKIQLK